MTRNLLFQALPFKLLHDNEGMAFIVFNAMNGADIGVIKQGSSPSFAGKALQRFGIPGEVFWDEFQRDVAPELEVFSLIDHAHTTAPEFAEDAVMGNLLTDHESVTTLLGGNVRPRTESGQLASRLAWLKGGRRVAHVLPLWAVARKNSLIGSAASLRKMRPLATAFRMK